MKVKLKTLLILILSTIGTSSLVNAQTATTGNANIANETNNNNILLNNAANSKPKDTFLNLNNNGGTTASTTPQNMNLTDEQKQLSTSFVNQNLANKILTDKCSGDQNQQMCAGQDPNSSQTVLIQSVAKAYAMMGPMLGDDVLPLAKKPKVQSTTNTDSTDSKKPTESKPTETKGEGGKGDTAKKDEKASDYCKYIPTATETIATVQQQMTTTDLSKGTPAGQSAQYDTLMKAVKNHEDRAKGAQIQETGWYGGAACYALMGTMGGYAVNTGLVVKLGAAVFLGHFYQGEVDTNKGYAEKTKAIADLLPKPGDCNPVTQNECYCNQPNASSDQYYATYCQAQIKQKAAAAAAATHGTCVNNLLAADINCACAQTNTCVSQLITSQDASNTLGFGTANSPFSTVRGLTQGQFQNGSLSGTSSAQTRAIANKALNDLASKYNLGDSNLTAKERAQAKIFQDSGIPANIAAAMAHANIPKGALENALAKVSGAASTSMPTALAYGGPNHLVDFSGGNGLGIKGKTAGNKNDDILSKFNIGKKDAGNSKVIEFAVQKAQSQNQITKSDSSIFEIISNRYSSSGRRLLQVEEQN